MNTSPSICLPVLNQYVTCFNLFFFSTIRNLKNLHFVANLWNKPRESVMWYMTSLTYTSHVTWMTVNCLLFATFLNLLHIRVDKLSRGDTNIGKNHEAIDCIHIAKKIQEQLNRRIQAHQNSDMA